MRPEIRKKVLIASMVFLAIGGVIELTRMQTDTDGANPRPMPALTPGQLDCSQADTEAFISQFMEELGQHEKAVLGPDPLAWRAFENWVNSIHCIDGAYAEGIMGTWEDGISKNFDVFLAYYRLPESEKPRLKLMVESIYNASGDDTITQDSRDALRKHLAKNCPAEFQDLCGKK